MVRAQLCPTLCDPKGCGPLGSSVLGIFPARTLEWVAISYSRASFWPQGLNLCLLHWQVILHHCATQEVEKPQLLQMLSHPWVSLQNNTIQAPTDGGWEGLEAVHSSYPGLSAQCLMHRSGRLPGPLGKWWWVPQLPQRHCCSQMDAKP